MKQYDVLDSPGGVPIKAWIRGVPLDDAAATQLRNVARLPFIHGWVAAMPDVHWGIGATVGCVIPTVGAIVPAAVGVDIGCGMAAVQTTLTANDLPESLRGVRAAIERAVPHGRTPRGRDKGSWEHPPAPAVEAWARLKPGFDAITARHETVKRSNHLTHLGTLGTGNHFIEVCLDEGDRVWVMLHSGSRGVGNKIGRYFIELAKKDMARHLASLPDQDLAYFKEGAEHFDDYVAAVGWAQDFATTNRRLMMDTVVTAVRGTPGIPPFETGRVAVNCHHNYVARERHLGREVFVTRKGAVRAGAGDLGIIPGCLAEGTRVLMADGTYKNIEAVRRGESVITGGGAPAFVSEVFERGVRETWEYQSNIFHCRTAATPDHRHLVGDLTSVARSLPSCGWAKALVKWSRLDELPEPFVFLSPRRIGYAMPRSFATEIGGVEVRPSYQAGYLFGTFLGDGTCRYRLGDGGQVSWTLGLSEEAISARIGEAVWTVLNAPSKVYVTDKTRLVVVHDKSLAQFFTAFGKKSSKALPHALWCADLDYLRGVYDGLIDTDGHTNNGTKKFTNTSSALIEQFSVIHQRLFGYFPSVSIRPPSRGGLEGCSIENCRASYRATSLRLPPLVPSYQIVPPLAAPVPGPRVPTFDLSLEGDDPSFVANGLIVHNSMGTRSYIVRGRGNPESFESCSHGAGRAMSRNEAKRRFTLADHARATEGVECRKDADVLDETPGAYKAIDAVMAAQTDLVEVVHTLRQVVCVKG